MDGFLQRLNQRVSKAFHARGQRLNREVVPIAIDHQSGQSVAFTKDPAIRLSVRIKLISDVERFAQAFLKERFIDFFRLGGEDAEGNQRVGMIETPPEEPCPCGKKVSQRS